MRTTRTIGFAISEEDRPRVDRLTELLAGGNRSELLRQALDLLEARERAQDLLELQVHGASRLEARGVNGSEIPGLVERALSDPDPEALATAKLLVADLRRRRQVPVLRPDDRALTQVELTFREELENNDR